LETGRSRRLRVRTSARNIPPPSKPRGKSPIRAALAEAPRTVKEMVALEQREKVQMGWSDHVADWITSLAGSMLYVWSHVFWFAAWILANTVLGLRFDAFPFGLLTMIVSLEAIFLSTFVLISQNRQATLADKRAKLDLQVNMVAEDEVTKLMGLVAEIHEHLGLSGAHDDEVRHMQKPTRIHKLADAMESLEQQVDHKAARGPDSAADTEA
jgi:uncharacterized membrane protein